jgi:hypothetical protein
MKNYLFILAFVFSINSAEQKEQKEQKAEFELDVVKVKEGFQVTPLPKELIILTMGFLPKQFNLKIPPSNRPNKDKNITNYSVEGCLNVGGMQTGPLADYYLEDEEQNYNNGFAVANHLIEIFNSVDLNNNQLDLL